MIFADLVRARLRERGDRVALTCAGEDLRFCDINDQAERWGRFLDELEVPPGARVGLALESSPLFIVAHLGNLLGGRVTVPLNPALRPGEMSAVLARAGTHLLVAEGGIVAELGEGAAPHLLERRFAPAALAAGGRSPARRPPPVIEDATLALLPFTSGTTGRPKGVRLTHGNLAASAAALEQAWALGPDDHLLLALPLFHVHGLCVGAHGMLASGHRITLLPRFDAAEVLARLAADDGPTLFYGVPTMYARLAAAADGRRPWPRVRLAVSGSAPLPEDVRARCRELFGVDLLERYGMTETLMSLSQPLDGPRRPGWLGEPLPGVEVRVVDAAGDEVPDGTEGELCVRGPAVTPGYWADEDGGALRDGWLRTGDLGLRDPDHGEYRLTGRAKELVITGGMNVHPREVEACLAAHPAVREAAVAGLADADLGETVAAWVVRDGEVDAAALAEWCRARLAPYKIPRRVFFVAALPRNALGKLQRAALAPPA